MSGWTLQDIASVLFFIFLLIKGASVFISTRGRHELDRLNDRLKSRMGGGNGDGRDRSGGLNEDDPR